MEGNAPRTAASVFRAAEPAGTLESQNGGAGLELRGELHRGCATICIVTHDPRYANHAERTVHLFDGQIVSEDEAQRQVLETVGP